MEQQVRAGLFSLDAEPLARPDDGTGSSTLIQGFGLLRLLAQARAPLTLAEIVARTRLSKTTAFRLLATLVQIGYVFQDPTTRAYAVDYTVLELVHFVLQRSELRGRAAPYLFDLAGTTGLSTVLSVLARGHSVVLDRVTPRTSRLAQSSIGNRVPAHASAAGKVILAYCSPAQLAEYLASPRVAYTATTIVDETALRAELGRIRGRGFAISDGESNGRIRSLGAPIRNFAGDVIAALGLSTHDLLSEAQERSLSDLLQHAEALLHTAESISYSLGYHADVLV